MSVFSPRCLAIHSKIKLFKVLWRISSCLEKRSSARTSGALVLILIWEATWPVLLQFLRILKICNIIFQIMAFVLRFLSCIHVPIRIHCLDSAYCPNFWLPWSVIWNEIRMPPFSKKKGMADGCSELSTLDVALNTVAP